MVDIQSEKVEQLDGRPMDSVLYRFTKRDYDFIIIEAARIV
jgi:hypothetical protein